MAEDGILERRTLAAGKVLFRQGEEASAAYLIQSGKVEITRDDNQGNIITVAEIGAKELVGEMALLAGNKRTATAKVIESAVVVTITLESLNTRYRKSDPLMKQVIEGLIKRLYTSNDKIQELLRVVQEENKDVAAG